MHTYVMLLSDNLRNLVHMAIMIKHIGFEALNTSWAPTLLTKIMMDKRLWNCSVFVVVKTSLISIFWCEIILNRNRLVEYKNNWVPLAFVITCGIA